jgi:hypothetical protein
MTSVEVTPQQERVNAAAAQKGDAKAGLAAAEARVALYLQIQEELAAANQALPPSHEAKLEELKGEVRRCEDVLTQCRNEYVQAQQVLAECIQSVRAAVVSPTPHKSFPPVPPLKRTLFYGRGDENASDWTSEFKSYVSFYNLSEWDKIRDELRVHLKGSAFAWFEDRVFSSLDDFFHQFRHEYGERLLQDRLVKKLHAMAPTTNLAEYVRSFRSSFKLLEPVNQNLVWACFAFLNNVPGNMLTGISSAIMNATSVDVMFDACADSGHIKSSRTFQGDMDDPMIGALSRPQPGGKGGKKGGKGGKGGNAPVCPKYLNGVCHDGWECKLRHPRIEGEPRCYKCGSLSHLSPDCK